MKNTKIICTLGPASEDRAVLTELVKSGMNVARLNFSHGDHAEQGARMETIRDINKELGTTVALLLDTKGPEIRTHLFKDGITTLEKGSTVRVSMEEVEGTNERFSISYAGLINDVEEGSTILLDDGLIELLVTGKDGVDIITEVRNTGVIKNRKGVNVPNVKLNMPFISEKDRSDMEFGCDMDVDFIAASFVRRRQDVLDIKEILKAKGNEHIQIIAKIENQEGVDNLDEILEEVDGIMVARGDLGVEVPAEEVPVIQKDIIAKCNATGKIAITATQMLDSMQKNPRPTRAEVSDVANAVLDGTDAIMLSGESAAGDYPVESVQMMARIAVRMESELDYDLAIARALETSKGTVTGAIGLSVSDSVLDLGAKAVVASTWSGKTARAISRFRPAAPIIAATPNEKTVRSLALNWGVHPVLVEETKNADTLIEIGVDAAADKLDLAVGDVVMITGGLPTGEGNTNFLKVHTVER
jgi:pyruvate kinase